MLSTPERTEIERLWARKLQQDTEKLPLAHRHRNLEPESAEIIAALAAGIHARTMVEIGGSSGISTIALAAAARHTGGKLISIELEPVRQAEARATIARLGLSDFVDFILRDAAEVIPTLPELDFALIDCEKEDYIRFFDALCIASGGIVVADNIISHDLSEYVAHVHGVGGWESVTVRAGKGLEVSVRSTN